jgi:hypothetical protein
MVYECPDKFQDIDLSELGDQKKVTDDLLNTVRCALQFLADQGIELDDNLNPELRKRFTPVLIDKMHSYGVVLDPGTNNYKMDDSTSAGWSDPIDNLNLIDRPRTNCYYDAVASDIRLPVVATYGAETKDIDTSTMESVKNDHNTYWYVGWSIEKQYALIREWLEDEYNDNVTTTAMPSICRAQTFTPLTSGVLSKVQVKVESHPHAESELFLEIRTTSGGKPTTTVIYRESCMLKRIKGTNMASIALEHPPKLTSGTKYALVLRSPFTSYDKHYGWGGWGVNCPGTKYANGDAYTSYDNGKTWILHGYDLAVPYSEGMHRPREFWMQTFMKTFALTYPTTGTYRVYWKPLKCNPITYVQLIPTMATPANTTITLEVSTNNVNWHAVTSPNWNYTFSGGEAGLQTLYVRATLASTAAGSTPSITGMAANVTTTPALNAYLVTKMFYPRLTNPLGASLWSRIGAPHHKVPANDSNISITVDICRGTLKVDRLTTNGAATTFQLAEMPREPLEYVIYNPDSGTPVVKHEKQDFTVNYATGLVTVTGSALAAGHIDFEYYPLWRKGLTATDFQDEDGNFVGLKTDVVTMEFEGNGANRTFTLTDLPADPIKHVLVGGVELIEDVDFTVNYLTKTVTLNNAPPANSGVPNVEIKYTPYLADLGMGFAYRLTRTTNVSKQAYIEPNFLQNRV